MTEFPDMQRLGRIALTAFCIGTGAAALSALPFGAVALAKNGDHGGQGGNHGGNSGGGHSDHGGSGAGNNNGGGNGGGNANGHSVEHGPGQQNDADNNGPSDNAGTGDTGDGTSADSGDDDQSLSPHGLGKLNGFFHASPNALANASPNSSIGQVAQTFRAALSEFAAAEAANESSGDQTGADGTNPTPPAPTVQQLGAILAGATNKPVTAAQVQAIADRLAELHPEDAGLADFAANADEAQCQDIADAANAAHAGMTSTSDDDTTTTTAASE